MPKEREMEWHTIHSTSSSDEIAKDKHRETCWGAEAIRDNLKRQVISVKIPLIKSVVSKHKICLQKNPHPDKICPLGTAKSGNCPGVYRQIDFSELSRQEGYL